MNPYIIAFICVYAVALCFYFFTRVGKKLVYRAVNKAIMATMYLVFAFVMFHVKAFPTYFYVLMAALFLAYMGDLFLVFDFNRGGDFFLAGNVCFSTFYLAALIENGIPFASYFWILIAWAALIAVWTILFVKLPDVFKLGKMKFPMLLYLSSITMHGMTALAAAVCLGGNGLTYLLMGIGSLSFMASDYILTVDRFVCPGNKWIVRSNSLTYFGGLLLVVFGSKHCLNCKKNYKRGLSF